ncbi:MAG: magnesium transporter [Bacteroidales bacterium]|jgi:magnesium transporter|nr:magnesium transporter [Bacteroidales bacterium]
MKEIQVKLRALRNEKQYKSLKFELNLLDPIQIAELIENSDKEESIIYFRLLSRELAKESFQQLSYDNQEEIIYELDKNKHRLIDLLNDLDPDDRTAFFEELPEEVSQKFIRLLSEEERKITNLLLGYPEDSIGRLMTTDYVAVKPYFSINDTLEHIRKYGKDSETLNVIYIVDNKGKLIDDIRIKEILLSPPETLISEIYDNKYISLNAFDDQEVAINKFQDYDRVALPVVDGKGILLGIVTIDDVMDVAEEESTEDFHRFGGAEGLDLSYTKTSLFELIRKRASWLVLLFFGEMLTASAMGFFEGQIQKVIALALFIPLVISSGGNSGSQAASLIIRSLALEELKLKNWWTVMKKELLTGFFLGLILGIIGFIRIVIWQTAKFYDYGEHWVTMGLTVSITLVFVVMWGTLSGSMIPFVLKLFKLDPATASAPFVATLVDVSGLVIYFSFASLFIVNM